MLSPLTSNGQELTKQTKVLFYIKKNDEQKKYKKRTGGAWYSRAPFKIQEGTCLVVPKKNTCLAMLHDLRDADQMLWHMAMGSS
jgi:hypothetical protein